MKAAKRGKPLQLASITAPETALNKPRLGATKKGLAGTQQEPAPDTIGKATSRSAKRVFISHSLGDKDFASLLESSLIAAGPETFRVEHHTRTGHAVPGNIDSEVGTATALVFIISSHSIHSQWIQEELSAARMRQRRRDGFQILPVLIDNLDLPVSVLHGRYTDFRGWRGARHYRKACLKLIGAMGIAPHRVGSGDLRWCARWSETLRALDQKICDDAGLLCGGLDSAQGFAGPQSIYGPVHYTTVKRVLDDDDGLLAALMTLSTLIKPRSCSERLLRLRRSAQQAAALGKILARHREQREDYHKAILLYESVRRTRDMLRDVRFEFETVVMSTFAVPAEKKSSAERTALQLKGSATSAEGASHLLHL